VPEFLLEIGFEEMPAGWLGALAEQLGSQFKEAAERELLQPANVEALWASRRLVVRADVAARQEDREEKVWGPSLRVARDPSGEWTSAALGFARKQGAAPGDLAQEAKDPTRPGELNLLFVRKTPGRPASQVLASLIPGALRSLAFPKRMNWDAWLEDGKGAFPFGRPIRWLLALLDGEVVPFRIYAAAGGVRGDEIVASGACSFGHRFLPRGSGGRPIEVRSFADLKRRLREAFVLVDPREREAVVADGLTRHAGRRIGDDHGLLPEWRDLVEYPTVVAGRIPLEFASLPPEVLETVLVHHQKYVPLELDGRAAAAFAAVINTDAQEAAAIVRGMERVVVARLRDAAFFFEEDRRRPLADRIAELEGVTFHRGLGSYKEKTDRVVRLVDAMGARMGLLTKPEHEAAREAARLAKADLTTLMVREFPELQGVMGGIYLQAEGSEWDAVARAVRWHYHPLSVEEASAPARALAGFEVTVWGALSMADKLDTLAGYFGQGLVPTGSSDPYGLRRAAQGVIRVLLDFWKTDVAENRPSLRAMVPEAVAGYGGVLGRPREEVVADLLAFFFDRLRSVLMARGYPSDEVEAAVGAREPDALEDPHECYLRVKALHQVRSDAREDFEHLAVAFKRAKNILDQGDARPVETGLFEQAAERDLYAAVQELARANGGYESRLRALARLRTPVDRFFDDVLVMAEDPRIRSNRLGLLSEALAPFYRIADISKLGG
jgi:glycyl-tRNA synthetase beta chain